jgi:hypothetical protein
LILSDKTTIHEILINDNAIPRHANFLHLSGHITAVLARIVIRAMALAYKIYRLISVLFISDILELLASSFTAAKVFLNSSSALMAHLAFGQVSQLSTTLAIAPD